MEYTKKISVQWNKVYDQFKGKRLSVWREEPSSFFVDKIEYLKSLGVKRVLDAGCGDGRNASAFISEGFDITGVDISESAINKCQKKYGDQPNARFTKLLLDDLNKNFKENSFDLIICDFVLVHMENISKILQNFHILLKKGGYALLDFTSIKDPNYGQGQRIAKNTFRQHGVFLRFYTLSEIKRLLKKFDILSIDSHAFSDPWHGSGYHRTKRHGHHSYYVFAQKQ